MGTVAGRGRGSYRVMERGQVGGEGVASNLLGFATRGLEDLRVPGHAAAAAAAAAAATAMVAAHAPPCSAHQRDRTERRRIWEGAIWIRMDT